jgi:hypothetical protein
VLTPSDLTYYLALAGEFQQYAVKTNDPDSKSVFEMIADAFHQLATMQEPEGEC